MTISTMPERYEKPDYYYLLDSDDDFDEQWRAALAVRPITSTGPDTPVSKESPVPYDEPDGSSLADRWQYPDIVAQLVDELAATGRDREAAAIRRVLGHDDDEAAMRAYVSRLWAEDWMSPEDSIYDE
jgi:hypothetical protein